MKTHLQLFSSLVERISLVFLFEIPDLCLRRRIFQELDCNETPAVSDEGASKEPGDGDVVQKSTMCCVLIPPHSD